MMNNKRKGLIINGILKCGCGDVENRDDVVSEGDLVLWDLVRGHYVGTTVHLLTPSQPSTSMVHEQLLVVMWMFP